MNESWEHALALYDSLSGQNWSYIRPFRVLLEVLAQSKEATELTAVTSHATLTVKDFLHICWVRCSVLHAKEPTT